MSIKNLLALAILLLGCGSEVAEAQTDSPTSGCDQALGECQGTSLLDPHDFRLLRAVGKECIATHYYECVEAVIGQTGGNSTEAAALFSRACEAGLPRHCSNLAWLYQLGENRYGIARQAAAAIRLYKRGCEEGDSRACTSLAATFHLGIGVDKNPDEARAWIRRGCEGGDQGACELAVELASQVEATLGAKGESLTEVEDVKKRTAQPRHPYRVRNGPTPQHQRQLAVGARDTVSYAVRSEEIGLAPGVGSVQGKIGAANDSGLPLEKMQIAYSVHSSIAAKGAPEWTVDLTCVISGKDLKHGASGWIECQDGLVVIECDEESVPRIRDGDSASITVRRYRFATVSVRGPLVPTTWRFQYTRLDGEMSKIEQKASFGTVLTYAIPRIELAIQPTMVEEREHVCGLIDEGYAPLLTYLSSAPSAIIQCLRSPLYIPLGFEFKPHICDESLAYLDILEEELATVEIPKQLSDLVGGFSNHIREVHESLLPLEKTREMTKNEASRAWREYGTLQNSLSQLSNAILESLL